MIKAILSLLAGCVFSLCAPAQTPGVVTRTSKYSVAESIDRVEAAVKAASGFQVFSRVDFQALAAAQGGKVRPTQLLLFGRGTVLQPLLPQHPLTAIDLPLKILAWEGDGFALYLRRLERGTFAFPPAAGAELTVTPTQLAMILGGLDPATARQRARYARPAHSA